MHVPSDQKTFHGFVGQVRSLTTIGSVTKVNVDLFERPQKITVSTIVYPYGYLFGTHPVLAFGEIDGSSVKENPYKNAWATSPPRGRCHLSMNASGVVVGPR